MSDSTLSIYLNDHLGLIAGEIELIRRVASENDGTPLADYLSSYDEDVTKQREAVKRIVESLGHEPSSLKQAAGWFFEKVGRLKPNDALTGYTDLARVIELEALISAAHSRFLMWEALRQTCSHAAEDSARWEEQASRHMRTLQQHHGLALQLAFESIQP